MAQPALAGSWPTAASTGAPVSASMSTWLDFPSAKLGQLLGYKGLTIQKVKEKSGVTRLHIPPHEKEKAKTQHTIPIEVQGTSEQIDYCRLLLEAVCAGDQSELGHATQYLNVEPSVIGKLMGFKGKTVKEMTEATGAYIEIQQDRSKGMSDTPQLFFAGPAPAVESAVQLAIRFIASPGAKLEAVLHDPNADMYAAAAPSADGMLTAIDPEGPKEERFIEVPMRRKGHLLGLHGQTIEMIRQATGVIKCHILADRDRGFVDKTGSIPVQVFGAPDRVAACIDLIERVISGDHSGIGHITEVIVIEPHKVDRLRGDRWQVINTLKDLTSVYMDLMTGVDEGVPPGETHLFLAGVPENVERAKTIVEALLQLMDQVPADGDANPELIGNLISNILPGTTLGSTPATAPALKVPAPTPATRVPVSWPPPARSAPTTSISSIQEAAQIVGQYLGQVAAGSGKPAPVASPVPATIRPLSARGRSRSPRRGASSQSMLPTAGNANASAGLEMAPGLTGAGPMTSTTLDFPSGKLGQLLGFKGLTIQKVKERSGVTRLHIPPHEKERAKYQNSIPIEVQGTAEQIDYCRMLLESVCAGDQSDLGHVTKYVGVEPSVIGKLMGFKGKTVKEMTEATGAYIEIQQDRSKGMADTPQLFVAGPADAVENAVQLILRFVAAPGAKLETVLAQGQWGDQGSDYMGNWPASAEGAITAIDPEGPKEERTVEVPARRKGHLLGLHGQTIELVRQTSGVIKCHILADRERGRDKTGTIPVQVFGAPDRVATCISMIERIVAGDHSSIGHSSEIMMIDPSKVDRLKGDRWQVINTLKDLTGSYMDLLQGAEAGLAPGETQLFFAGPPENVERARTIVTALLTLMDSLPASGQASPEALGNMIGSLLPQLQPQASGRGPVASGALF